MRRSHDHLGEDELARRDALLMDRGPDWWHTFYQDRARPVPFFGTAPDESLVAWADTQRGHAGRALDLGCGNGRNAVFLASRGFAVDTVDHAAAAADWARQHAAQAGASVNVLQASVFDLQLAPGHFDLIYDAGCFHHLPPHRRRGYVDLVSTALAPGGWFGLSCFRPEGGSGFTDDEVYERRSLGGGLGYTEPCLRAIWSAGLQVRSVRPMVKKQPDSGLFGEPFLWALLAQKA